MMTQNSFTLTNPISKELAFRVFRYDSKSLFEEIQRPNYYSIIIIEEGTAKLKSDFSEYEIIANSILTFSPYQAFSIIANENIKARVINFHSDFFCIFRHQEEVSCNGIIFNNIYQEPILKLDKTEIATFIFLYEQMENEIKNSEIALYESIISYLKIFLINATRIKISQNPEKELIQKNQQDLFIVQKLKDTIEDHFKQLHSASQYASLLNMTSSRLAKISKKYFKKTISELISERIIIEAKRELYLTSKAVKLVAFELGFSDEYYFSRFFKKNTKISPQYFREKVGYAKAEIYS